MAFLRKKALEITLAVIVLLLGSILGAVWGRVNDLEKRLEAAEQTRPLTEYILNAVSEQTDRQTTAWEVKMAALEDRLTRMEARLTSQINQTEADIKTLLKER